MGKISCHEFRPGYWAKLVDGRVVGRATPEEAKAWQREQAEEGAIWEDVLRRAGPPEPRPSRSPRSLPRATEPPGEKPSPPRAKPRPAEAITIWEDVLRQAKPQRPSGVSAPGRPPAEAKPAKHLPAARAADRLQPRTRPAISQETLPLDSTPPHPEVAEAPRPTVRPVPPKELAKAKAVLPPTERGATKPKVMTPPLAGAEPVAKPKPVLPQPKVQPESEVERPAPEKAVMAKPKRRRSSTETARRRTTKKRAPPPAPRGGASQMYLWIMADPKDNLEGAIRAWLPKYEARFDQAPGAVLCHPQDLAALESANLPLEVRQAKGVPPHHFWIGPK